MVLEDEKLDVDVEKKHLDDIRKIKNSGDKEFVLKQKLGAYYISKTIEYSIISLFVVLAAYMLYPFFGALLLAFVVSYILYPLVFLFKKFLKSYVLSLLIALMIILIPTGFFIYSASQGAGPLIQAVAEFSGDFNNLVNNLKEEVVNSNIAKVLNIEDPIDSVQILVNSATTYVNGFLRDMVTNLPMTIIKVLVFLIASFYFMKEGHHISAIVYRFVNNQNIHVSYILKTVLEGVKSSLDLLFVSYITTSVITMVLAWTGYEILHVPYAFILAVFTGLFAFLPVLGAWMVYGAISIYFYSVGNELYSLIVLLYGIVIINLIPEVWVRPVIGSKKANVHPVTILFGFFAGPIAFGMIGLILGPMILVICEKIIVNYLKLKK